MWTASHAANCPSEDRSASLVNLLLQPLPPNFDSETQLPPLEPDYKTLIRLNLWAVIDGHGGGCVATYASEVLLPHIAASISRALGCAIVDRGVCTVNGQLRDANALDLDSLIKTSVDNRHGNPNSIQYRSPYERSDSEEEEEEEEGDDDGGGGGTLSETDDNPVIVPKTAGERKQIASLKDAVAGGASLADSLLRKRQSDIASVSSVKTSVKTAASPANREDLLGTHSPREVAAITRAITESFLAVDEGWINSVSTSYRGIISTYLKFLWFSKYFLSTLQIDPVATHQTSCQSNGRWNSGACALVVFTIQRLDWTSVSEPDREKEQRSLEKSVRNTTQNQDAARRRMLDYASRAKSASSMSTVSSTSSLTTEEAVNASGIESEITETEGEDDDRSFSADIRKRDTIRHNPRSSQRENESLISPPGGCLCHCYRPHAAIIYTAHVGDCRAVLLGSAPPRTIKVGDFSSHPDTTDDESSHHSSDETECLSSSDHDADSSEDEDVENGTSVNVTGTATATASTTTSSYMNFPRRVVRQRTSRLRATDDTSGPYIALPPLEVHDDCKTVEFEYEEPVERRELRRIRYPSDSSTSSQDSIDLLPLVHLPPVTRPIDLTTDHSAYNPAEVTAVLRRCNNAPRAISSGVGGGIKRVAGSLAVTRALGDAYLKTPLLSFLPYKSHAPYITARPEVNCRPLVKDGDKVLILATDGVWERASGEDVLRWVRNFYEERIAEAERRNRNRSSQVDKDKSPTLNDDSNLSGVEAFQHNKCYQYEGLERDLFERNDTECPNSRKREMTSSPVGPMAKRRKRSRQTRMSYNVADVITRRVLNKVRRARNISSLQALMSLPPGRARRSKHDDITASVVDLSEFVS
jgi:serine/threonine protein phosphatase PrpC